MRMTKLVLPLIVAMIFFIGMPHSVSASEVEIKECAGCHKDVAADKVAMSDLEVTVAEHLRQMPTGFSQPEQQGFYDKTINYDANHATSIGAGLDYKLINADYLTGYKSRPGWSA